LSESEKRNRQSHGLMVRRVDASCEPLRVGGKDHG
jgi:hypothetical protein